MPNELKLEHEPGQAWKRGRAVLGIVMAGVLATGLTACDQKPSTGTVGQVDNETLTAADTAEKRMDQVDNAVGGKTDEAGQATDDTTLAAKVKSALVADSGLNAAEIGVDTAGGVVTLSGTADTSASRDKAIQVASSVEGVKAVKNNLVVVRGS